MYVEVVGVILCEIIFVPTLPLVQFPRILSKYMERVGVILCETIFIPVLLSLQFPMILSDCVCGEGGCCPA